MTLINVTTLIRNLDMISLATTVRMSKQGQRFQLHKGAYVPVDKEPEELSRE